MTTSFSSRIIISHLHEHQIYPSEPYAVFGVCLENHFKITLFVKHCLQSHEITSVLNACLLEPKRAAEKIKISKYTMQIDPEDQNSAPDEGFGSNLLKDLNKALTASHIIWEKHEVVEIIVENIQTHQITHLKHSMEHL